MLRIEGGICAVPGVLAAGARQGKYGVALIKAAGEAAGMFTTNKVRAAPLDITGRHLAAFGRLEGIIATACCANAYTGREAWRMPGPWLRLLGDFLAADEKR